MAILALAAIGAGLGAATGIAGAASLGWGIGSTLGQLAFGAKGQDQNIVGPTLDDTRVTGAGYGDVIPFTSGHPRVAGAIWWASDRRAITTVTQQDSGGKGGGGSTTTTTTTTYEVDLLIGLADNEIAGVSTVWENGKAIYNTRPTATTETSDASTASERWSTFTVYTGTESQMPDPDYEAWRGVGNTPAFRGRAYVFIKSLQLGGAPANIPNLTFELGRPGAADPNFADVALLIHAEDTLGGTTVTDTSVNNATQQAGFNGSISNVWAAFGTRSVLTSSNPLVYPYISAYFIGTGDFCYEIRYRPTGLGSNVPLFGNGAGYVGAGRWMLYMDFFQRLQLQYSSGGSYSVICQTAVSMLAINTAYHVALIRYGTTVYITVDGVIRAQATFTSSMGDATIALGAVGSATASPAPGYYDEIRFTVGQARYTSFPFSPPGAAFPGVAGGDDTSGLAGEAVDELVTRICERAGLAAAQFDVTALTSITRTERGLADASGGPSRALLEAVAAKFFFECVCTDKLYFIPRGGASVASIPYAALGASRSDFVDPLPLRIANDIEQPAMTAVSYANVDMDYNSDTQVSDRMISAIPNSVRAVQIPSTMTASEAKAVADVMMLDLIVAGTSTRLALLGEYARLIPTDPVTVTDADNNTLRLRLVKLTDSFPLLEYDAVLDDVSALTSQGVTSDDYVTDTAVAPPADTVLELLDIPIMRDEDNDSGFYAAAAGSATPWGGAFIYRSVDDVTFSVIGTIDEAGVLGTCNTTLGDWTGKYVFDEKNSVTVNVGSNVLASVTYATIIADTTVNAAMIGSEMIQFRTATLVTPGIYTLTGLLRGLRGTDWAMIDHVAAERFVLLRGAGMRRMAMQTADISALRYYKGVSAGRTEASATSETFTNNAVGLKPFAPVYARASRDGSNNLTGTFARRTRLSTRLLSSAGSSTPLGESSESYEIDVYADGTFTTVVRTITSTTETFTYSAANQTGDGFTPGDPIPLRIYQLSAVVGRGYPLEATL